MLRFMSHRKEAPGGEPGIVTMFAVKLAGEATTIATAADGTAKAQDRTFKTSTHPALTNLSVKPAAFRASGAGATIAYIDTDPATTTFTVLRCAIPLSHGARCARFVNVATFTHRDHAGHNKLLFRARIGSRTLSRGIYRLNARPRLAGKSGSTASAKFQILA